MKKGKLFLHAIKAYGGMEVRLHVSLTSALDGDEWLSSYFRSIYPHGKTPGMHLAGDRVGPRTDLGT